DFRKRTVQRRRLSRSGRTGHVNDPVRLVNHPSQLLDSRPVDNQLVERQQCSGLVQDAHDDFFAKLRRDLRHTEIDLTTVHFNGNATILRQAQLRDIQSRKDLESGYQRQLNLLGEDVLDTQYAVDAKPQYNTSILRLDMDVAGALLNRKSKDVVGQPHNRRV